MRLKICIGSIVALVIINIIIGTATPICAFAYEKDNYSITFNFNKTCILDNGTKKTGRNWYKQNGLIYISDGTSSGGIAYEKVGFALRLRNGFNYTDYYNSYGITSQVLLGIAYLILIIVLGYDIIKRLPDISTDKKE